MKTLHKLFASAMLLGLAACASGPEAPSPYGEGSGRGHYKVGQPYTIDGVTYVPREDYNYDETGIASWYGPGFHGRYTANGEVYDQTQLTAAHRTLPMPSLVRVTNLDNGKSIVVRINDRGPYSKARILDMSDRAASLLGYKGAGTAKVRVQILAEESRAIADAAKAKGTYDPGDLPPLQQVAAAEGVNLSPTDSSPLAATSLKVERISLEPELTPAQEASAEPLPIPATEAAPDFSTPLSAKPKAKLVSSGAQPMVPAQKLQQLEAKEAAGRYLPETKAQQGVAMPGLKIYVQAGAFSVKENALKLKAALSKFGPTSISTADIEGKTFSRVRIGPFSDVAKADKALADVLQSGEKNARVVVDK